MDARSKDFIHVRLYFEYPPPAVADCRVCWLFMDLNTCCVVADLESVIKDKFDFSRGSIISLFIEDCYLPHTESVDMVRDNERQGESGLSSSGEWKQQPCSYTK